MLNRFRIFCADWLGSLRVYSGAYSIACGVACVLLLLNHGREDDSDLIKMLLTGIFVFPLMIVGPLMTIIRPRLSKRYAHGGQIVALLLAVAWYSVLPEDMDNATASHIIHILLSTVLSRLMPLAAIIVATQGQSLAIWGWSKQYVMRLIIALVSALIVWGGISASLASIEYLFGVELYDEIYLDIAILAGSLLASSVVLAGMHDDRQAREYNSVFRFFGLYIFVPLAVLYAMILCAYGLKILVTGVWPHDLIVWMVIGYMIFGLVAYVLTHPLDDYKRLSRVHQGYFVSLVLFTVLLGIAIGMRIDQYGWTMDRYFVVMIGVWMVVMSSIALIRPSFALTGVISSLLVLGSLSIYGPQSAFNLPSVLQYRDLVYLLQTNNFLTESGHIAPLGSGAVYDDQAVQRIGSIAEYLTEYEGVDVLQPLYAGTGFEQIATSDQWDVGEKFVGSLGVDPAVVQYDNQEKSWISYYRPMKAIDVSGYRQLLFLRSPIDPTSTELYSIDPSDISVVILEDKTRIDLADHLATLDKDIASYETDEQEILFVTDAYRLVITNISAHSDDEGTQSGSFVNNGKRYVLGNYEAVVLLK